MKMYAGSNSGFTFLEIIAVLILVGIISAIVISRASSKTDYLLDAEVQILKSNLRHTQARALSDDETWGINLSGTEYGLWKKDSEGVLTTNTSLPNESGSTHKFPDGVSLTSGVVSIVTFNSLGSPGTSTITLTLSANGQSQNIIITSNTGFIP